METLGEKCGVVGIWTQSNHAAVYARRAMSALQHRGQESAGMSVLSPTNTIKTHTGMGLIPHVLTEVVLKKLGEGKMAIGHNRYATSGKGSLGNAHPIVVTKKELKLAIAHNGNIPDLLTLRKQLPNAKKISSDTTLVAMLLMQERKQHASWKETLINVLPYCHGGYNFTILTNDGSLFGVRDPFGIWSLCLGKLPDGWIIASESVAFDAVGADFVRDIEPGEIITIDNKGKISSTFFGEPKHPQHSLFEYVYFARPDSFINGRRIRYGRELSGKYLGERIRQKHIQADAIVPVFASGYPAAKGVASELQLPMVDAITTSHYVGRTFIQPGQEQRVLAVNGKHNIVPDEIVGKRIIVVDDSVIRLTTRKALTRELREAGAKEIYFASASPPVVNQCDMGIDMRIKKELGAAPYEKEPLSVIEQKIAEHMAADGMIYLPIDETAQAMGGKKEDFYWYPFGGPHPIRDKQSSFPKRKKKIIGKPKLMVFISGNGSNLQKIIDGSESGDIDAEITAVISNNEEAYGLTRAKKHHLPTVILPYKGKLRDEAERESYEKKLIEHIEIFSPNLLLLSGWMFILSNTFLRKIQQLEIPIINHHPALLSEKEDEFVYTTRGSIPVIRGIHAFAHAYKRDLPVSGITVHQVLPGETFDIGPIIMKTEVRRKKDDTEESFEKRIRAMEYLLVPAAIKRAVHVMKSGIDISKGEFPW